MSNPDQSWTIRAEAPADAPAIEALNNDVFGSERFARSAYRLREGLAPLAELGLVAVENGILRGSVRFWPIRVGGMPALLLGPLAVHGDQRGRGIGVGLMQQGIEQARKDWDAILLVGDEPYYGKVGFTKMPEGRLQFPGPVDPARLLGFSLKDGALEKLSGVVTRA